MENKKSAFALIGLFGKFVLALAVGIGIIGKTAPHLFMNVPNVGFILWAMTGNPMPPHMSPDAWTEAEMKTWIRDGDVVVATGTKSGTTWMLYCAHQIRMKGNDEAAPFTDITYTTPWPDLIQNPGSTWSKQKPLMETTVLPEGTTWGAMWNNPKFPFRVFKSHYAPDVIPIKKFPNVKFLAMSRNGLDVVRSIIPFFDGHTDEFRKTWGGCPPPSSGNAEADAATQFAAMMPGGYLDDLYFHYVKMWWEYRNEPNVMLLHFSDAKRDLHGTVANLAEFYGVSLTEAEHVAVVDKCSFEHMKKKEDMFMYALPLTADFKTKKTRIMRSGTTIRKGISGEGKLTFTAEQQALWEKAELEQFPDEALRNWARNGGAF